MVIRESKLESEQERSKQLAHELKKVKRILEKVYQEHEEDRKQISRELHDEIAQILTALNFELAILSKKAAHSEQGLRDKILDTQNLVQKSMETIHDFAKKLRPKILDDLGLVPALTSLVKEFIQRTNILVLLSIYSDIDDLCENTKIVLFRVAQEALNNIEKHANSSKVSVIIKRKKNLVEMEILDNGKSFNVNKLNTVSNKSRLGLLGMKERIQMAGGKLIISSSVKNGTSIKAQIKIKNANAEGL